LGRLDVFTGYRPLLEALLPFENETEGARGTPSPAGYLFARAGDFLRRQVAWLRKRVTCPISQMN
jgi:hypothetical protein